MTGQVYTVASGKGGVGKTTTAINLGAMLAEAGNDVVVVDTDLGMANIAGFLDFEMTGATLHDVLAGEAGVPEAIYEAPGDIDVLPSSTDIQAFARSETENLPGVVAELRAEYDFVLLDTGAGISYDTMLPLSLADAVLLVTTPDVASVRDTAKSGELTEHVGGTVRGAVLTQRSNDILNADDVEGTLETEILAVVPEDETVPMGIDAGRPLAAFAPNAPAAAAYRELAELLAGESPREASDDGSPTSGAGSPLADAEQAVEAGGFDDDPVHDLIDERIVDAAEETPTGDHFDDEAVDESAEAAEDRPPADSRTDATAGPSGGPSSEEQVDDSSPANDALAEDPLADADAAPDPPVESPGDDAPDPFADDPDDSLGEDPFADELSDETFDSPTDDPLADAAGADPLVDDPAKDPLSGSVDTRVEESTDENPVADAPTGDSPAADDPTAGSPAVDPLAGDASDGPTDAPADDPLADAPSGLDETSGGQPSPDPSRADPSQIDPGTGSDTSTPDLGAVDDESGDNEDGPLDPSRQPLDDTAKAPWEAGGADPGPDADTEDDLDAVPFDSDDQSRQTDFGARPADDEDDDDDDEGGLFGRIGSLFR